MKATILNLAIAASFGSVAVAQPHRHGHPAHHHKRDNSPLEEREVVTTYVPATITQYMLGDKSVSPEEAHAGLDKGLYVVVGETTPTFTPPPAPVVTSTSSKEDGVFIEKVTSSSSTSTPTPTPSTTTEPTSTSTPEPEPTKSTTYPVSNGAKGIDADFPDGQVDCTTFPSDYGALALDYLGLGGWSGLQYTPNFSLKDLAISFIETGIGKPAGQKGFYSYACPPGYIKSQWPSSQGNTGQSIGGLYCNDQGKLELTRGDVSKKLCEKGIPGITIKNKMSSGTSVCRTDYPGTENMVIPIDSTPGSSFELANVASNNYYVWQGKATTLQYYVNKKGVSADKGCVWVCDEDPEGCGNWAPINIGVGQSSDGITYLSIFPNSAVSKAKLDFNIDISGDITSDCYYHVDSGFAGSSTGCTTGIPSGGQVTITLSD
ncbi:beta-glucosidase-domain-containing protein [Xylaria bambusicola]|uniref:beta-glucosidase-domain-containing protein n=1 Tax=Xylaria bambusicola TaxID=326684 RepID=UPI0020079B80|nr:beta-glucosidase-domain-containing protein [Xylaria bambusicola]KAI0503062.1 beta-glucosidase-domain-containing protein [Xylaria bambusicola]